MISDLYRHHSETLNTYVTRRLGERPGGEDITQDVWLWALEQCQPPSWPALQRAADQLIRAELTRAADAPNLVGLRPHPTARPVVPPSTTVSEVTPGPQRLPGGTRSGKTSYPHQLAAA